MPQGSEGPQREADGHQGDPDGPQHPDASRQVDDQQDNAEAIMVPPIPDSLCPHRRAVVPGAQQQ